VRGLPDVCFFGDDLRGLPDVCFFGDDVRGLPDVCFFGDDVRGLIADDKWKPLGIIGVLYLGDACWLFITASMLPTLSLNKDTVDLEEHNSIFHTILESTESINLTQGIKMISN
jgi:hypothetical protein